MLNFFEDSEPAYTQEELDEYKNKRVTYTGEEMTEYEASQKQRAMERRVRKTKRELAGYGAGIQATSDDSLKAELKSAFDRKSVLLKKQEARLKDFTNQTGLMRDRAREQSYGFNKSVSQKAVWSNKQALQIEKEKSIIKEIKEAGIKGVISLHPEYPDLNSLSFDAKHINERNHNVTREEAESFIKNSRFTATRWNGEFIDYFSDEGAVYLNLETKLIRTAFKKEDYTDSVRKALEVLNNHEKR